ncbi:MAG: homoserine/homoserine lactone efflux protein [Saprospiraceae bacterium]|jgi:homoserine/homoserine lactone efflux protein
MSFSTWALFFLTITAASISPGPNVLLVIMNTLKHGIRGAAFTVLGNLTALLFIALLAAIGVGTVIKALPYAYTIMKWVGGFYLIWMGFKLIKNTFKSVEKSTTSTHSKRTTSSEQVTSKTIFVEAIAVSASNPKAILFLTAIFPQFISIDKPISPQFAIMFASIIMSVMLIHGAYAGSSVWFRNRPFSVTVRNSLSRFTGGLFITLGLAVAFDQQ